MGPLVIAVALVFSGLCESSSAEDRLLVQSPSASPTEGSPSLDGAPKQMEATWPIGDRPFVTISFDFQDGWEPKDALTIDCVDARCTPNTFFQFHFTPVPHFQFMDLEVIESAVLPDWLSRKNKRVYRRSGAKVVSSRDSVQMVNGREFRVGESKILNESTGLVRTVLEYYAVYETGFLQLSVAGEDHLTEDAESFNRHGRAYR